MTLSPARIAPCLMLALFCIHSPLSAREAPFLGAPSQSLSPSERVAERAAKASSSGTSGELLCAPGASKVLSDGLGLYDTGKGLTLRPTKAGQACSLMATAGGLNIQFPGQLPVLLAGPVNYRLNTAPIRAEVSVAGPALCESYYTAADRLELQLTDTNGDVRSLRGLARIGYVPSAAKFSPEFAMAAFGPYVQCYTFPFASLTANPPAVPAIPPVDADALFASGFDDTASIELEILNASGDLRIRETDVLRDQAFSYRIRLTNSSDLDATGIRVREFVPAAIAQPLLAPVVNAGSWSCTDGQGQPCADGANGTGVLNRTGIALPKRSSRTYLLTRTVTSGVPTDRTLLGAAVFFNPTSAGGFGDSSSVDNSAPLVLKLVANQAPTVACSGLPSPVNLNENAAPVEYTCALSDPEGDAIASFIVLSNSNNTLIPTAGALADLGSNSWRLRLAPATDLLGTANLLLRASDDRGAQRDIAVTVNVNDINSPPSFDLLSGEIRFSATGGLPRDASGGFIDAPDVSFGSNCSTGTTCSLTFPDFLKNRSVGLAPESPGQQLLAAISCGAVSVGPSPFQFAPSLTPATGQSAATPFALDLTYRKVNFDPAPNPEMEVLCTVTVTDTGSPPQQLQRTLRFTINP